MPTQNSYQGSTPVELLQGQQSEHEASGTPVNSPEDEKAKNYVISWRNQLRAQRVEKISVWNECWSLYRGQADFSAKEDWQSQIVLPKAWGTVKSAVSVIKRFLNTAKQPWFVDATNQLDPVAVLRSEKMTNLTKVFLDKAHFVEEFSTGLEVGFVMGLGVWKVGWWLHPRTRMRVQTVMVPASQAALTGAPPQALGQGIPLQPPQDRRDPTQPGQGPAELGAQQNSQFPTQLPQESTLPPGSLAGGSPTGGLYSGAGQIMIPQKQTIREEIMEGRLSIQAVDPYNFYWLPGSKLNRWTGTIEEMEVPKWELMDMASRGAFDPALIDQIGPMKIDEYQKQSWLRFGELPRTSTGPTKETGIVRLTEFYGPLIIDDKMVEPHAHIIIANDTWVLLNDKNDKWHLRAPYCAFSPLQLPFRTEGVGLVEMVRSIDRALDQITNLGVDTLLFRLMPVFEFTPDVYENPEDLKTGLTPGKIFRRNTLAAPNDLGLKPIQFEDVSPGAAQMSGILDRAHQEGGLVSELQQSLPRWSGAQTATETEAIQNNQNSFFGALASDIEQYAIAPIIEMSLDTIMQYVDTANDPRIGAILGIGAEVLAGMGQADIMELITGDYEVIVRGLSGQLEKAEMLQNLIQFMNLIGQNPQAWLPYINQDALLRRMLESFRPVIHDIEEIIADPQTVQANRLAMQQEAQHSQMLSMLPELARLAQDKSNSDADRQQAQMTSASEEQSRVADQAIAYKSAKESKNAKKD